MVDVRMFYFCDWELRCVRSLTISKLDISELEIVQTIEKKINRFLMPFEILDRFLKKGSGGLNGNQMKSLKEVSKQYFPRLNEGVKYGDIDGGKECMDYHHSVDWGVRNSGFILSVKKEKVSENI